MATMTGGPVMKRTIIAGVILLDGAVVLHLAGNVITATVFVVFVAAFLLPACALVMRFSCLRMMPPDLRLIAGSVLVVALCAPWFFARKLLPFSPAIADIAVCAILTGAAAKFGAVKATIEELRPAWKRSRFIVLIVLPVVFALAWLGYAAPEGREVRFDGLFAVDLGFLTSVVATLRASPVLPLAPVVNGGFLHYHWLYLTLPGTLVDFCGAAIPASNALILVNVLAAARLVHALATVVCVHNPQGDPRSVRVAVAVVLFAPFTIYYYQIIAARFSLGWLAMPTRNHLLLSPANSMIVFGNNTFALVLVLFAAMQMERWNRERRMIDVVLGTAAVSLVIGYSATLLFPLVAALLLWLAMGRIARPMAVLAWAVAMGSAAVAMFLLMRLMVFDGSRHVAYAFDSGQFMRIVILGLMPLWVLLLLDGRKLLSFFHVLIVAAIAVPSFLYIAGNATGNIDFSMKTGSLLAVSFAPLIASAIEKLINGTLRRWEAIAAVTVIALGAVQTSAYILQFPYYRLMGSRPEALALSADYYHALVWLREHTPRQSIVVEPGGLTIPVELPSLWIAERRAWLPTPYVEPYLNPDPGSSIPSRTALWTSFLRDPGNDAVGRAIAAEADYLLVSRQLQSPFWTPVSRSGSWMIYRSVLRSGSPG
jgi:hypothetical protein